MLVDELLAEARLADLDRDVAATRQRARWLPELHTGMRLPAYSGSGGMLMTDANDLPIARSEVGPLGEGTPGFVSRRRAWLHRLLAAQRDAHGAELS
ncbi:MAG TPA: hypothetical protein VKV26_04715 [Dehalococcoidia bacterium]|nr:hypothetical protein [Dehalococcoidia bacterium]